MMFTYPYDHSPVYNPALLSVSAQSYFTTLISIKGKLVQLAKTYSVHHLLPSCRIAHIQPILVGQDLHLLPETIHKVFTLIDLVI